MYYLNFLTFFVCLRFEYSWSLFYGKRKGSCVIEYYWLLFLWEQKMDGLAKVKCKYQVNFSQKSPAPFFLIFQFHQSRLCSCDQFVVVIWAARLCWYEVGHLILFPTRSLPVPKPALSSNQLQIVCLSIQSQLGQDSDSNAIACVHEGHISQRSTTTAC